MYLHFILERQPGATSKVPKEITQVRAPCLRPRPGTSQFTIQICVKAELFLTPVANSIYEKGGGGESMNFTEASNYDCN